MIKGDGYLIKVLIRMLKSLNVLTNKRYRLYICSLKHAISEINNSIL